MPIGDAHEMNMENGADDVTRMLDLLRHRLPTPRSSLL